jgi:hypothetical protein
MTRIGYFMKVTDAGYAREHPDLIIPGTLIIEDCLMKNARALLSCERQFSQEVKEVTRPLREYDFKDGTRIFESGSDSETGLLDFRQKRKKE